MPRLRVISRRQVGDTIFRLAGVARPLAMARTWPLTAILAGFVPLAIGYACGSWLHQIATALRLALLFWACVCEDRCSRATAITGLVLGSHSALAIFLSANDPAGMAAILPGSADYWAQTRHWIETGQDAEYEWGTWLPRHLALFVASIGCGLLTLGLVAFARGIEQVDLMNYYVGQLAARSDSPTVAILFGWHPWSILRGLAYTVLIFESSSLALSWMAQRPLSNSKRRAIRWGLGIGLAIADMLAKLFLAPVVRNQLFGNLNSDSL